MDVGFIGLGHMGKPMAANLLKAGHRLSVWNRSPGPAEELERQGARKLASPSDAFAAEAVVTMLADDAALRTVILDSGALSHAQPGLVHVVSATISVDMAKMLAAIHADAGIAYVCAPVMGRPDLAQSAQLNVLAAGEDEAIARIRPLLEAMGRQVWPVGSQPHMANVMKLAVNFHLAAAMETMAEGAALVRRHGIEPRRLVELLTGTLFAAPAYKTYGPLEVQQHFQPALFKLPLGLKDIRETLAAAEEAGVPMPFASILRDNFVDALAHGDGDKDWSAISAVAMRRAGLE